MAEATPRSRRPAREPGPWLTKGEAAARAGFSVSTIERAVRLGELRASGGGRPGGEEVRIHETWVDAWVEARGDRR